MMMGYGFGSSFGWLGMGMGLLMHFEFTALVIMAVIWMFKAIFQGNLRTSNQTGAIEILKKRYAKGEINGEEYQRMKKELE
jgi:putative membrane protein